MESNLRKEDRMKTTTVQKRDAVERVQTALMNASYRCISTGLVNVAQSALEAASMPKRPTGEDFSVWYGRNGVFVLVANDEKQTYSLYKDVGTSKVDDDIALL
jgi:hypothetical protein